MGITDKGRRQMQLRNPAEAAEKGDGNEMVTKTKGQSGQAGTRPNKGYAAILVVLLVGALVAIGLIALGIWSVGIVRQIGSGSADASMSTETIRRHGTDEVDVMDIVSLIVMIRDGVPEDEARAVLSGYGDVDGQMADVGIWLVTPMNGTRGTEQLKQLGERMENEHPDVIESAEPDLPVKLNNDATRKTSE